MITKENIAKHATQIEKMELPVAVSGSYDAIKLISDDFTDWSEFDKDPELSARLDKFINYINDHIDKVSQVPQPVAEEKVKEVKKPRKERQPRPKKEKPAKAEKHHVFGEYVPVEIKIMKRYLALGGKTVYMEAIRNLLTSLQKAIRTHEIRKTSKWAREIMHIQKNLLNIWNNSGESTDKVQITLEKSDTAMFKNMEEDTAEYAVSPQIVMIKRFLSIQGKTKIKAKAGLMQVAKQLCKKATEFESANESQGEYKYKHEIQQIISSLSKYISGETKTVHLSSQELNGLAGLGLIDYDHKIKVGDKVRTYDSARGRVVKVFDDSIQIDCRPGHYYSKKKVKSLTDHNGNCGCSGAGCLSGVETETVIPETNAPDPAPAPVITLPMPTDNNTISSEDFAAMQFKTVGFAGKWRALIGDPAERWNMMVWSKPGKGKSTLMIEFAKYLASEHGRKVLYVAKEEGFGATLLDKFTRMDAFDPLITIAKELPQSFTGYDYVFLDSVTSLKLVTADLEAMIKANPLVNFMFIYQATVDGNYRGDKEAEHLVDVSININDNGFASAQKTRFGGKGTINVFPSSNEQGGIYKFTTLQQADTFKLKPENSTMRIVFGDDGKIWVCSEKKAEQFKARGFDIL